MEKNCFVLKLVCSSSKSLNLPYIQQISPQFIYFISLSSCGKFQICGEFTFITLTCTGFYRYVTVLCELFTLGLVVPSSSLSPSSVYLRTPYLVVRIMSPRECGKFTMDQQTEAGKYMVKTRKSVSTRIGSPASFW